MGLKGSHIVSPNPSAASLQQFKADDASMSAVISTPAAASALSIRARRSWRLGRMTLVSAMVAGVSSFRFASG